MANSQLTPCLLILSLTGWTLMPLTVRLLMAAIYCSFPLPVLSSIILWFLLFFCVLPWPGGYCFWLINLLVAVVSWWWPLAIIGETDVAHCWRTRLPLNVWHWYPTSRAVEHIPNYIVVAILLILTWLWCLLPDCSVVVFDNRYCIVIVSICCCCYRRYLLLPDATLFSGNATTFRVGLVPVRVCWAGPCCCVRWPTYPLLVHYCYRDDERCWCCDRATPHTHCFCLLLLPTVAIPDVCSAMTIYDSSVTFATIGIIC